MSRGWNPRQDWSGGRGGDDHWGGTNSTEWTSPGQDWNGGGASASDGKGGSDDSQDAEAIKSKIHQLSSGYWADDYSDYFYWSAETKGFQSSEWDDSLGKKGWWKFLWHEGTHWQPEKLAEHLKGILAKRGVSVEAEWSNASTSVNAWQSDAGNDEKWNSANAQSNTWGMWSDNIDDWAPNLDRKINWHGLELVPVEKNFYDEHYAVKNRPHAEVAQIRSHYDIQIVDVENKGVPNPVTNFEEASLPDWLLYQFQRTGWTCPTPIQIQVWPVALQGRDVIGIAETGSGKTLAYLAPMMVHIVAQEELKANEGPVGVVLCPTRELAIQINDVTEIFIGVSGLRSTCVYGGVPAREQGQALQEKNDIVIATPGRFIQLLNEKYTNLNRVTFVVLDEADEMLSKGFGDQIQLILSQIRPDRQMLMFSATWPAVVQDLARKQCKEEPVIIRVGGDALAACKSIAQRIMVISNETKGKVFENKLAKLHEAIKKAGVCNPYATDKCLVFCRTKASVDELVSQLNMLNIRAGGMHSDMEQKRRMWTLEEFKKGEITIMIATNCLGRGHDIKNVKYVINFDAPDSIESYIHRIGRTGRAGAKGFALTMLSDRDYAIVQDLVKVLERTEQPVPENLREMAQSALVQSQNYDSQWAVESAAWESNDVQQVPGAWDSGAHGASNAEVGQAAWASYQGSPNETRDPYFAQ